MEVRQGVVTGITHRVKTRLVPFMAKRLILWAAEKTM